MLTLLTGTDPFLLIEEKQALEKAFLKQNQEGKVSFFDFGENTHSSFVRQALEEGEEGLFVSPKCIFLRQVSLLPEEAQGSVLEVVQNKTAIEWIIIEPGSLRKTDVYVKRLMSVPALKVVAANAPSDHERHAIVQNTLKQGGVTFDTPVERLFLERVGTDTAKLYGELQKIITYKQAGAVTKEEIEMLLEPTLEDTGFQALDAVARGDREKATLLFRNLFLWKKDALPILGLCAWQIRQIIVLREAFDRGMRQSRDLAEATGISPYVVGKLLPVLPSFPQSRLKKAHAQILTYDQDIKLGLVDQAVAVDLLVWQI